ncbi:MAG: PorT family protein [Prolixibacteraceae bacterium]|nr:PorT family protein [Prolixibacteraceae bacterium]
MKRILFLLLFLLLLNRVNAQWFEIPNLTTFDDKKIHFGFTLGLNTADFAFQHYNTIKDNPLIAESNLTYTKLLDSVGYKLRADVASLTPGFTVGIVSNLRLTEYLDLRFLPGLSFIERKVVYNIPIYDADISGALKEHVVRSTYLDFALLLKYKSKRIINHRPYMIGGLSLRQDISKSATEDLLQLRKSNFYVEAGMGWDLYLQFFRLSTELKYCFGLGNILSNNLPKYPQNQFYQLALKNLNSHMLILSFHFE